MKGAPIDRRSLGAALIVIVIWSTSFSFAKEAIHHLGPWLFRCYSMAIAMLPLLPFVRRSLVDLWILPMVLVAIVAFDQPLRMPSQFDAVGILYAGLLNGALVFWLWYYAIRGLGALRASWFTLFVPILGAAFAAAFFSERLGGRELLGIGLISLSMLIQRGVSRRQAATTP